MSEPPLTAVVTGANRGLGQALAWNLAARRHAIVGLGVRDPASVSESLALLASQQRSAFALTLDYRDDDSISHAAIDCARHIDHLDLLINCAAVNKSAVHAAASSKGPLGSLHAEALVEVLLTNVVGPVMTSQAFLPLLSRSTAPIIVNISTSRASVAHATGQSFAYGVSKAALNMATRKIALTMPAGCSAVAVDPGWLRTHMGGEDAPTDPADAADTLLTTLLEGGTKLNGRFIDAQGADLPW